jgi:hypothetical protein
MKSSDIIALTTFKGGSANSAPETNDENAALPTYLML